MALIAPGAERIWRSMMCESVSFYQRDVCTAADIAVGAPRIVVTTPT